MGTTRTDLPSYQRIAINVAENIANGHFSIGQKLSGRTTLAGHYGVSPETIRKAISVLQDLHIVSVIKGSGIVITSLENAAAFAAQYKETTSLLNLKNEIAAEAEQQKAVMDAMFKNIGLLMDLTERYTSANPFVPFKILLTEDARHLGMSLAELNFWHATGATVIAIHRREQTILSPGPYEKLKAEDTVYFVGEHECLSRVKSFFNC